MKRLLFYLFPPKRIEIVLCNRDFAESGEYKDNIRCPLATAFKRKTGLQPFVCSTSLSAGRERYDILEGFDYSQYQPLSEDHFYGRPINHKITLIKQ
jgi:hypothetical protein